jgi:hypothetical protein
VDTPGDAVKVAVAGDLAFVADGTGGLRVVDVSIPTSPFPRGVYTGVVTTNDVAVVGEHVYVAGLLQGLRIVDVSDPDAPVEVGAYDTGYHAVAVDGAGAHAFVADGVDGVYVLLNELLATGAESQAGWAAGARLLLGNHPNPFNPVTTILYRVPDDGPVRLGVYDLAGRELARLVDGRRKAGAHEIRFDGTGLPSGVYFTRLVAAGRADAGKMVLVK